MAEGSNQREGRIKKFLTFGFKRSRVQEVPNNIKVQRIIDQIEDHFVNIKYINSSWKTEQDDGLESLKAIHRLREVPPSGAKTRNYDFHTNHLHDIDNQFAKWLQEIFDMQPEIENLLKDLNQLKFNDKAIFIEHSSGMQNYINTIRALYERDLAIKRKVAQEVFHAKTAFKSHVLIATWYCHSSVREIKRLATQLETSPVNQRWDV